MYVMNQLKTKAYKLNEEEKVPIIKKLARKGGTVVYCFALHLCCLHELALLKHGVTN